MKGFRSLIVLCILVHVAIGKVFLIKFSIISNLLIIAFCIFFKAIFDNASNTLNNETVVWK